jgi:Na+/H+-translocating membrane pyrophosphatase
MATIVIYVGVLALLAGLPIIIDMCFTYKTHHLLIKETGLDKMQEKQLQEFLKELGATSGIRRGLARSVMALTVIVILGIAVIDLLAGESSEGGAQIINNILSMLAGLLAAITGFYFGGRTTEKAREERKEPPGT